MNKMDDVEMRFAMLAHELRTPLSAIMGYCELLQITAAEKLLPDIADDVSKIQQAGQYLLSVINQMLFVSSEKIVIQDMLDKITAILKSIIDAKQNQLKIHCDEKIKNIKVDITLMQCLINLISNAVQHTQAGEIVFSIQMQNEKMIFEVRDTGVGMSAAQIETVFQPFHTTREVGVGLGLYLTKQMIEKLGGDISVCSEINKGTVFTIRLFYSLALVVPE